MACPYFYPVQRLDSAIGGRLPLGDPYSGLCHADPKDPFSPDQKQLCEACNLGYARRTCSRFPHDAGPDAIRFSVSQHDGARVKIYFVLERQHHPYRHGALEYSIEGNSFAVEDRSALADDLVRRQAQAYIQSYLRRTATRVTN